MTITARQAAPKHTVSLQEVTPDIARLWLSSRPYKGQRSFRPAHVKYLAEEMERGKFRETAEVVFAVEDDRHFMINGQHTLNAIAQCGIPQTVTVFCYQSSGDEETAALYGVIDTNLARTVKDLFSAMYLREELAFTAMQINNVGSAIKFIGNRFSRQGGNRRVHHDDMIRAIREYTPATHEFLEVIFGHRREVRSLFRVASMSLALVSFRFSAQVLGKDKISTFWKGVAFDDGLASDDPRKTAHRHLITSEMSGGGNVGRSSRIVTVNYSARYLSNCFNAYIEGRSLSQTIVRDATAPIRIIGSPFTGKV